MAANLSNIMAVEPESRKALRNARRVLIKGMFDDGVLLQSFWYLLLTPSFIIHHPFILSSLQLVHQLWPMRMVDHP